MDNFEPHLPIYENIKRQIRRDIASGKLKPGDRLPSENGLAERLGVSRGQTRQALRDLEMEGLILRSPGRGSFVANPSPMPVEALRRVMVALPGEGYTYYTHSVIRGFTAAAAQQGVHTMFYYLDANEEAELGFLRNVSLMGVEGLALYPMHRSNEECEVVRELAASKLPLVLFDRYLPDVEADFVGTDNRDAFRRLTTLMAGMGHKVIAYVSRDLSDSVMEERLAGYIAALEALGLESSGRLRYSGDTGLDMSNWARDILNSSSPPTAIIASDQMSLRITSEVLAYIGVNAPGNIALAAMDDRDPLDVEKAIGLAAAQDGGEVGAQTARLLMDRIAHPELPVRQVLVSAFVPFEIPCRGATPGLPSTANARIPASRETTKGSRK